MPIFESDEDREHFLFLLDNVTERFDWTVANWVLMPNHHHLLIRLREPNLDEGMHRLHGLFAQRWNVRNASTGHVLFRRYKNVVLRRPGSPGRVSRYIDLNPVRAGLCARPSDWQWGGFTAIIGRRPPLRFHDAEEGLRAGVELPMSPEADRLAYARAVALRLEAVRNSGTPADTRPNLSEILIPGDIESLHEAHDTWWYSIREIAQSIDCGVATVHRWMTHGPATGRGGAFERWTVP